MAAVWLFLKVFAGRFLAFLRTIPWQGWACVALIVLVGVYGHLRYNAGQADVQKKFDAHLSIDQAQADKARSEAEKKELAQRATFAAIQSQLVSENADARAQIDRLSADLAAGRVRLRQRFTCRSVPEAAAGFTVDNEAGEGGFNSADAETAFGIASDGDAAIRQLTACQAILKAER